MQFGKHFKEGVIFRLGARNLMHEGDQVPRVDFGFVTELQNLMD